jgi:alpha-L-fucosidase
MPMAVMFSDVGPDFRWVGNKRGYAGEPCWSTINIGDGVPGNTQATASQVRGNAPQFGPACVLDDNRRTYWATDDGTTESNVVLQLVQPVTFNVVDLREYLPLGQRVERFALDVWEKGAWKELASGTSIGNRRLVRSDRMTTDRVRLRITQAAACPAISEVGLYAEPE